MKFPAIYTPPLEWGRREILGHRDKTNHFLVCVWDMESEPKMLGQVLRQPLNALRLVEGVDFLKCVYSKTTNEYFYCILQNECFLQISELPSFEIRF